MARTLTSGPMDAISLVTTDLVMPQYLSTNEQKFIATANFNRKFIWFSFANRDIQCSKAIIQMGSAFRRTSMAL